jgi:hypothetical protein
MENAISEETRRILATGVSSMDHVDLLFHLRDDVATGAELAAATRFPEAVVEVLLAELEAAGLVLRRDDRWSLTESARDRSAIDEVLVMYNSRPVTLVRAIYARDRVSRRIRDLDAR